MSERARALEQALRMLRNECHGIMAMSYDAIKDSAGYTNLKVWIGRVEEADALLAVGPPPSGASPQIYVCEACASGDHARCVGGACRCKPAYVYTASPQAETSEDMGDGWYVTVGRWGESLVTIEQRCLSGKADLTDDDAALIRGAAQHLQAFIGQPAPVSPVEPEPPTTFVAKESDAYLKYAARHLRHAVDKADDAPASSAQHEKQALFALTHERIPTHEEALNVWVEPEPPEELPCYCDIPSHILDLGCPRHQAPQCEPEPPWREKYNELLFAVARAYPGESRHDTALRYIREKETAEACGPKAVAPLAKEESADV